MKTLTVRLPEALAMEIESEALGRGIPRSDVVRERLLSFESATRSPAALQGIADLIGAVDGLPPELSGQRKQFLKGTGYGRKRTR